MLTMEERMAANSFDRNLAFQAAETALREGEALALAQSRLRDANNIPTPNAGFPTQAVNCNDLDDFNNVACANGLCWVFEQVCQPPQAPQPPQHPPQPPPARWEDSQFNNWQPVSNPAAATSPLSPDPNLAPPQFFVEYLGSNFPCNPQNQTQDLHCKRYRITARSHDPLAAAAAEGRAAVVLQSIYAAE